MRYRAAAFLLSLVIVVLVGSRLVDFSIFSLGAPAGPLLSPDAWDQIGTTIGEWLWSFRVVDVLVQATLLLAAVVGASAMFRSMRDHNRDREEVE